MIDKIFIKGTRVNNLKNIDVVIPKNKIVSITGVSGSGQVEFSNQYIYMRKEQRDILKFHLTRDNFLKIDKPDVSEITGICPAIALEQKTEQKTQDLQ